MQYELNTKFINDLYNKYSDTHNFLIKTYPRDYLFYEKEELYNGIQKRIYYNCPNYQEFKNRYPKSIIIESQDHFNAIKYSDIFINLAGSSIALEAFLFTKRKCYSINFKNQPYYKNVSYLPEYVVSPDNICNIEINDVNEILESQIFNEEDHNKLKQYIHQEFSLPNILKAINNIIYN